jgi:quercetin dioxygenase-like cupin family protein
MKPSRLEDQFQFRAGKFLPKLVYGSPTARAFLLCLEAGQGLSPRQDSEEMICYLVRGTAALTIGRETFSASAGDFAAAAAGDIRGIMAEEQCVALWVHISRSREGSG